MSRAVQGGRLGVRALDVHQVVQQQLVLRAWVRIPVSSSVCLSTIFHHALQGILWCVTSCLWRVKILNVQTFKLSTVIGRQTLNDLRIYSRPSLSSPLLRTSRRTRCSVFVRRNNLPTDRCLSDAKFNVATTHVHALSSNS